MHVYCFRFVATNGGINSEPYYYPPGFVPAIPPIGGFIRAKDNKDRDILGFLEGITFDFRLSEVTIVDLMLANVEHV